MEHESKSQSSGRGKGRGRGRAKKKAADNETKAQEMVVLNEDRPVEPETITLDLDADITQLEAPTFSTINKGPPEPMLRLSWDHKTHLIGEKVINPMIHCCDKCEAPILIYGRMIPCKHVFCIMCAEGENKICPRCQEKVVRIEKTGLGSVFMCTFGGSRYGNTGCRRTYLSQRDLQAHINHRHVSGMVVKKDSSNSTQSSSLLNPTSTVPSRTKPTVTHHVAAAGDPRVHTSNSNEYFHKMHHSPSSHTPSSQSLRQSHHHGHLSHHSEQQSQLGNVQHQHSGTLQASSTQRHLPVSTAPQLLQPVDFVNQMMSTYSQPTAANATSSANVRSNLITIQIHDPNVDSNCAAMGLSSRATNFHQAYSPQFSQASSPGIPFPVPPPGQPAISPVAQSQFFSPTPLTTYPTTSPQRGTVAQFSPNSPAQSIMNQSQMMSTPTSTQRRPQFPSDPVMPPFPVPPLPSHRWHQTSSNQTHFY